MARKISFDAPVEEIKPVREELLRHIGRVRSLAWSALSSNRAP